MNEHGADDETYKGLRQGYGCIKPVVFNLAMPVDRQKTGKEKRW